MRLAAMTAEQRASVAAAFKGVISAARGLAALDLSRKATMGAIQMFLVGMASGHPMSHYLRQARAAAPKIGRYVDALVQAL